MCNSAAGYRKDTRNNYGIITTRKIRQCNIINHLVATTLLSS